MNYKKPIVVIGTGRSGTSLYAGILNYLGVYMGDNFIKPDNNNPTGHWEDTEFTELNRKAVAEEIGKDEWTKRTLELFDKRQKESYKRQCRWGWKIPITTNLIGWYVELGLDIDWVWIKRKPEDSIESCKRCYNHTDEQATELIMSRYKILEEAYKKGIIKNVYNFDDLVKTPDAVITSTIKRYGLKPTKEQERLANSIVNQNDKEKTVMIGIPTMGSIHTHLINPIVQWCMGGAGFYATHKESPVDNARNKIVRDFLKTNMDYLLFVDSDTIPPVWALKAMIKSNQDIVTGLTPMVRYDERTDSWATMYNAFNRERDENGKVIKTRAVDGHGLQEVERCGGSCLLIKREVLENMKEPYFLFDWADDYQSYTSEDIYFCDKAREMGYKIYANTDVVCKHSKDVLL